MRKQCNRARRTISRHHPVKALIAFQPIRQIFDQIALDGEIGYEGEVPVIRESGGYWCEFLPALIAWCDCWDGIARGVPIALSTAALRRVGDALAAGQMLEAADVAAATAEIDAQYRAFISYPRDAIDTHVKTARIKVAFEDLADIGRGVTC